MRNARSEKLALIVFAIVEALVIFGVVVPAMLETIPAGDRPHDPQPYHPHHAVGDRHE